MAPSYRLPLLGLLWLGVPFLLGQRRSYARDGRRVMEANPYPRRIEGVEGIPRQGSFVLVMNHYNRRGLRPQICSMIISAVLAEVRAGEPEISWVFAEELEEFIYAPVPMPRWVMRWMFRRLARMYGLVAMPRQWRSAMARAATLRRIMGVLKGRAVGLTPEAGGPGILIEPPPGTGLFLLFLSEGGSPLVPVGVYEEEGELVIRFGEAFRLTEGGEGSAREQDERAKEAVMTAIGRLLPERYQGVYRERIGGG